MRRAWIVPVALLLLSGGGGWGTSASAEDVYGGSGTVLDAPGRGPELCLGGVLKSLPPQCSGIPLVGWDWTAVVDEESASGTTWVSVYVKGTYDGRRFTLTAPPGPPRPDERSMSFAPACDDPEAIDLCLAERDQPTADELDAVHARIPGVLGSALLTGHVDYRAGKVIATVILADAETQALVDEEFGAGMVELRGALEPIG